MKKIVLYIILLLFFLNSNAQVSNFSKKEAIEYIINYYSDFQTGYDFDGKYKFISNNYKATFSGLSFILTFDTFDENKNIQNQTITFNLKDIIAIEPNGTNVVEIFDTETLILPICGKLAFQTKDKIQDINIYYEVDEDVTQTNIYKAFEQLITK
ncbi:MAG: hypothetical protein ACOH1N_08080 [Lutibacter sp.]